MKLDTKMMKKHKHIYGRIYKEGAQQALRVLLPCKLLKGQKCAEVLIHVET